MVTEFHIILTRSKITVDKNGFVKINAIYVAEIFTFTFL